MQNTDNKKIPRLFVFAAISILGLLVYSNILNGAFQYDDLSYIANNPQIRNPLDLQAIFRICPTRFITFFTFALNYYFNDLNVIGYHLVNITIHITCAIFVWWFLLLTFSTPAMAGNELKRHKEIIALFAGLIFVSHPIQTQAVTFIYQRLASLASLLYLASLSLYVKSRLMHIEKKGSYDWKFYYVSSLAVAIIGMFTKEMVFGLPFMILFYEFCFLRTEKGLSLKYAIPFLITLFVIPITVIGVFGVPVNVILVRRMDYAPAITSPWSYLFTSFRVIVTYLRLLFIPVHQTIDYHYPVYHTLWNVPVLSSLLLLISILIIGIRSFYKNKLIFFSIFWFFITIIPESSIVPIRDVINEHRLYLPMVGYSIFIVSIIFYLLRKIPLKAILACLAILVIIYSVLTYNRNFAWKDEFSLWNDAVQKSPDGIRPYYNRGLIYGRTGKYDEALADFNKVIERAPLYVEAYNNRGLVHYYKGEYDKAIADYNKAIKIDSNYAEAYNNRGLAYFYKNMYSMAMSDYDKAIDIDPQIADTYFNKGMAYEEMGRKEDAIKAYSAFILLTPKKDMSIIESAKERIEKLK